MPSIERRFTVPIEGDGAIVGDLYGVGPFRPKYGKDGGVTGYSDPVYDHDGGTVVVTFLGDPHVLDLIAAEDDVTPVD